MNVEHVSPDLDRLAELAASDNPAPVVMLNLNRYREFAAYPDGRDADVSGREAYLRYGIVARAAIEFVGGKILWSADAGEVVIGCEHDGYDEIVVAWYPSRAAFLRLGEYPGYMESHEHRDAALEQATLIACAGEDEPVLSTPF